MKTTFFNKVNYYVFVFGASFKKEEETKKNQVFFLNDGNDRFRMSGEMSQPAAVDSGIDTSAIESMRLAIFGQSQKGSDDFVRFVDD